MQDTHATYFGSRESGISLIGDLPWGSHFCHFYRTREDLLEVLVPYLRAGLQNHEFCLWVTDSPLDVEDASKALKKAVPRFDEYAQKGQMEIISRDRWHTGDGEPGSAIVAGLDKAISRGFDGLRLACNAPSEEARGREARHTVDAIWRYHVIAAFAYPRDQFDAAGLMAVVKNHRLAMVKNAGRWEVIESSEAWTVKDALRRSEEKLHSVFANMSEGFAYHRIVLDAGGSPCDYVFLEVNEAFERLTGLKREDLIGRRATQVLPGIEKQPADWIGTYGRVALGGKPVQFEDYSPSLRRWYSVSSFSPHKGFFAVTFSDITERKSLMESLHQSRERLNRAQEIARLGSWELDLACNELTWSDEVYRIFGLAPQEFGATYEAFLERVHPDDRAAVDTAYTGSLRENRDTYEIEHRVVRKDTGEIRIVHEKCEHFRDAAGRIIRSVGMVHDVTQRKQMEDQLRRLNDQLEEEVQAQTEELKDTIDRLQDEVVRRVLAEGKLRKRSQMLEAFFQHTITPLTFMDKHFNFVRVNEAYAKSGGRGPEHFVGKNYFALYPHAENQAIFERVVQTKQPYFAYAKPFTYPDDPERVTYWDWQLTPLLDEHGEVQFLVLNLEDVTERQTAFHELEHRAHQLQKLTLELSQAEDRERKRLAEILHDDLQQQLAAAKFHLSLLNGRVNRDSAARETIAQLDQILKDAIEKSRSLSHELSPAVLYQGSLGDTFEWLARQLQTKHGLKVEVENRGQIDSQSEALKIFLYKAAQEILFNVVKHARVNEARLRLQRMGGRLWLTISDKGQGFDPRMLRKAGGLGLLSIRERVELLGGRMKIRSAKGRGATFLIAVPDGQTTEDGRQRTVGADPRACPTPGNHGGLSLRVLLVDDHKVMREGLAALLNEQPDIEVVGQAGNGREAVDLAYRHQPDVVVMDVAMPVMAGDEATRQIKLHLPKTRIIALSMFEEVGMAEAMHEAGAETYLLKTAPSDELLAVIRGRSLDIGWE